MAEILTPDQVNLYRNMPESAQDLCRNLIATIDALAEALREAKRMEWVNPRGIDWDIVGYRVAAWLEI